MIRKSVIVAAPISKGVKRDAMNRLTIAIAGIVFFIAAPSLRAQRGGHWSAANSTRGNSQAMGGFHGAIAVEASQAQSAELRSWAQRTAALNRQLVDIRHVSKSRRSGDLSGELDMFQAALVADNLDRQEFLVSLSGAQQSVLKKPVQGLDRTNNAMAKAFSEIMQGSGQAQNTKLLIKGLQKARKAIATEQHEQQQLAREMGVTV